MKTTLLAVALLVISVPAHATCKADATDKKLAGAALTSFMKKCQADAKTACEKSAADLKLAGAARTSHVNKCVKDTVGT